MTLVVSYSPWLPLLGFFALFSGSHSVDVKGELHKDVLLPCVVDYKDEFDYNLVVNWQRDKNDAVVYAFFNGSSHPEDQEAHYKGRTEIFSESLPNGNASLLLRNLTESDAGTYTCRVILKQSSRHHIQYVNLIVYDVPVAERKNTTRLRFVASLALLVVLAIPAVLIVRHYKTRKGKAKDEENQPLYEPTSDPTKKYRRTFKKIKYHDIFERQLIVAKEKLFDTFQSHNVHFAEQQKSINVKELFTPENKSLLSKRMLLVGDAGTGKSYFCKWLEEKWAKSEIELYECIIYISGKKIHKRKETSLKEIVEDKCEGLSEVLQMLNVLLILDELDDLVYDVSVINDDLKDDSNTSLQLNTLIKSIINRQLFPDMDVLIVSRPGSPVTNLHSHFTSTFVLQELDDGEASNVYDSNSKISADEYKSIKDISNNPAFVLILCTVNRLPEMLNNFTSPYELLISFLQQYLSGQDMVKDTIKQLAEESYHNLVKGEQEKHEPSKHWLHFLEFFNCSPTLNYQCKYWRDMLAALHCVWELKNEESLKDCIDFWLFGTSIGNKRSCPLLALVVEEHHTKYYNFIRFFMRLLPYPDYKSLCNNTQNMDDNLQNLLRKYFRNIMEDHNENYEKLAVVHCVFELHDDYVTEELYSMEQFCLVNTPLNSLDIRALVYCFRNARLQKLDLRLCALTDQNVEELESLIINSDYVLLSSNRLTSRTGTFLKKLLKEPQCRLKRLSLGSNNLGPDGAQALWRALKHNTRLKNLYVYDNNIGDKGINGMVKHLLKNNSLEELHLCVNGFGEDAIEKIKMLKAKKTELKVVVTIPEDLELFNYAEEKIKSLPDTWRNYDQEWLIKLLEAVQADLQNKDWEMDARLTQDRVENLIPQIENIMDTIKKDKV